MVKVFRLPTILVIVQIFSASLFAAEIQSINGEATTSLQTVYPKSGLATLGSIYRNTRQARCYRCYEDGYSRYSDEGRTGYHSPSSRGYSSTYADDRSGTWYSRSYDRNDDRARYYDDRYPERTPTRNDYYSGGAGGGGGAAADRYTPSRYNDRTYDRYDRYTPNRYDRERYPVRTYDRYDRPREYDDRQDGYGRDRYYDRYDSRYPERDDRYPVQPSPATGGAGGYDAGYRVSYRPYDDYRGQSAIDTSTGRGYWFADRPNDRHPYYDRPDGPPPGPPGPGSYYSQNNGQPPPHPLQGGPNANTNSTGGPSGGQDYDYKRPQPHNTQQSSSGKDGYAGGWSYSNDRDKNNNNNRDNNNSNLGYNQNDRDKDVMSSPYGSRSRPLSGSYLHDRESNDPSKAVNQKPNADSSKTPDGQTETKNSPSRVANKNDQNKTTEPKSKTN